AQLAHHADAWQPGDSATVHRCALQRLRVAEFHRRVLLEAPAAQSRPDELPRSGAAFPYEQWLPAQIAHGQPSLAEERMVRRGDRNDLVVLKYGNVQPLEVQRSLDEAQHEAQIIDALRHLLRVAHEQSHMDLGPGPPEGGEDAGQYVGADGVAGADGEPPPLSAGDIPHGRLRGALELEEPLGVLAEDFPGLSEPHSARVPLEQGDAEPLLEDLELAREGGLGDVEFARRCREAPRRRHREEDRQVMQVHICMQYMAQLPYLHWMDSESARIIHGFGGPVAGYP